MGADNNSQRDVSTRFDARFLGRKRFWRAAFADLRDTSLYELFRRFSGIFPDHPSDSNTVLYLAEWTHVTPTIWEVLLWCDHFEHSAVEDVRRLVGFAESANAILATDEHGAGVELLDGVEDCVVLSFMDPRPEVKEALQRYGARGGAA